MKSAKVQIGLALQCYHDKHGHFPPAYIADENGKPMHSWRVLILPYLEEHELYEAYRFDEPWDGPNNRTLAERIPDVFCCPSGLHGRNLPFTEYVVVVGSDTAFPETGTVSLDDITDGTKNTILIVEIEDSDICWMEPQDLRFEELSFTADGDGKQSTSSPHPAGPAALFADGRVPHIRPSLPPETWRALLTRNGGEGVERKALEGERRGVGLGE